MNKSKVIVMLKSFTAEEFKRFEDMVASPYFNKNTNLVRMSGILGKLFPGFDPQKIKKEIIWNELFNGKDFNYGVMKNLIYELNILAEKFLILNGYEEKHFTDNYLLLVEFRKRALNDLFEKKLKSCQEDLSKSKLRLGISHFRYTFEDLEKTYLEFYCKNKNKNYAAVDKSNNYLISYFFSTFFYSNYNNLAQSNFFDTNPDYILIKQFTDFYEKAGFRSDLLTELYFLAIHITIYPEKEEKYFELKNLFLTNIDKLSRRTKYNMGAILTTYCKFKIFKNEKKYLAERFAILKFVFENNFYKLRDEDYMNGHLYFIMLELSLKLSDLKWAHKVTKDYSKKLNPVSGPNMKILGDVIIGMNKGNYERSLELLSVMSPNDITEKIKVKELEIKIYYYLEDYERVYSLVKGGKAFLRFDKSLSVLIRKSFSCFLDCVKKIIDIKTSASMDVVDPYKINDLKKVIMENEIFEKLWLFDLAEEMENFLAGNSLKRKGA